VLVRAAQGEHPVLVMPSIVYGRQAGLIQSFFVEPGRAAGAIPYIGDGLNHWALVYVEDIGELYALALDAPAGASYAGVNDEKAQMVDVARALSQAAGLQGRIASLTIEQARTQMGGVADAFALDQQITGSRARRQLGWNPTHRNVLDKLRTNS
jgi:nucleoside-diphosphate-sugar epimerase